MANRDLIFTILGIDKASPAFRSVGDAAERAGDRVDRAGSSAIKAMAGVAAASNAGGLAAAAAIGGVPLLFAGMAASAVSSNEQVRTSFSNLRDNVTDDVQAMAEPMVDDFVVAANELGRAWGRDVGPVLKSIFADPAMAHGVRELATGVGELAGNAMPGLAKAVRSSQPVMSGYRSLLGDVGSGVSDFAENVSDSSESAGRVITGFGRIAEDVLGDVGELVGDLADAAAPNMERVEQVVERAGDSLLGLADHALPILSDAAGTGMSAVSGLLGVLEPFQGALGTGLGVTLAAAGGWRLLTAAGNGFTKLDLGGRMERTALSAGIMTEQLTGSAGAGERVATAGSRMGNVLSKVGAALPIVGVAAVGLGLMLDAANQEMEQITATGRTWAEGLLKGGSEADRVRQQIRRLNTENSDYQSQLASIRQQFESTGEAAGAFAGEAETLQSKLDANNLKISETNRQYQEIRNSLTGAELAQVTYNEAVEKYGEASPEAAAAGVVWRAALDDEKRKAEAAAEATKTHTDRIIEQQNIMLGAAGAGLNYRAALLNLEQAQKGLSDATKSHAENSLEVREATLAYEQSLLGAITAAGEMANAEHAGASESERARLVTQAQATEILRLAAAAGTTAPASLMAMVSSLDATTLAALGVTARVNEAGQAVYRLPNGKEVVITGNNFDALAKINQINNANVRDKFFSVVMRMQVDSSGVPIAGSNRSSGAVSGYNDGGWVGGAGPDQDSVPALLTPKEFVVNRRAARKFGPLLEAINDSEGGTKELEMPTGVATAGGGPGPARVASAAPVSVVHNHYYDVSPTFTGPVGSQRELEEWLTRSLDNLNRKNRLPKPR
ncbi:hypothetical protein [Saccharothrix texasensis]|uniref:Uncharacterized protein n=1 Tax=Saccharothrix texasensis TaxID=103734 RepID=A0A3N1H198_9PSEU|nr:hypothetical protein [Saccharothrix texasensis]ROP36290.1 hypothetical protein EDD40_1555 [Saccharothrix texasensis]